MEVAALGRPFILGMLYDARKDKPIPGLILWDDETLSKNISESSQHSSDFEISASDTIESKSSLLDVHASLKASFLSGLIEVGGSAKYLSDTKKFKNQSRVTFQYKATTHFKQLSVTQLPALDAQQMDFIKRSSATHMVTGILYGANAFFVFDSEKLEDSSVQDIEGHMEAVIKKIPSISIEGQVNIKLTDEEKALTEKFSCKFYGDFILESNPATFEDAVKTYIQLPKLLGENGEKAVPMKVWLMPLRDLNPKAAELISGISVGIGVALLAKVQNVLEDLKEIVMRCNDSLVDRVVENLPHIQEELRTFQKLCNHYVSYLQTTLAEKLPAIRDGKDDERSARKVFDDRDESPFSHEKLTKWLDHKEREINVIRSCVDVMEGIKIVRSRSELDREVLAAGVEEALCFVFTSTEKGDAYLDEMAKYLDSPRLGSTKEDKWYYSDEVLAKMKQKAKDFHNLAQAERNNRLHFLIAAIANEKYKGATIYHYRNSSLVTDNFSKPDIQNVETIKDKKDLIWYACDLTLDPNTANNYLHLSEGNKKATCGGWQANLPEHPDRFDTALSVLCKEGLTGRHYWEVEWSTGYYQSVYAGVSYRQIQRKGGSLDTKLGCNKMSWCVGQYISRNLSKIEAYHDNSTPWVIPFPSGCRKLGVFLDWPAGTLSYYIVSSDTLKHLYTFNTRFTQPLYPGLWVAQTSNFAYLCPIE